MAEDEATAAGRDVGWGTATEPADAPSPRLSRETQEEVAGSNLLSGKDPDNYPLNSSWSFWFNRSPRGSAAGDFFANLRHLATVNTIKAFWSVFNNLPPCPNLQERESYHLMRDSQRRPVWEDLANVDGGTWTVKVHKEYTARLWQEMLLAAVGEQLSRCVADEDEICGVSVSTRYDCDVLQIWHQDSTQQHRAKVLDKLRDLVPEVTFKAVFYQSNRERVKDSMSKSSSSRGRSPHPPGHSKSHVATTTGRSPPSQGPVFGPGMITQGSPSARAMGPGTGHAMGPGMGPYSSPVHRYSSPIHPPGELGAPPVPHSQPRPHHYGHQPATQAAAAYSVGAPGNQSVPLQNYQQTPPNSSPFLLPHPP